jgi:replication factor C subunit 3/5
MINTKYVPHVLQISEIFFWRATNDDLLWHELSITANFLTVRKLHCKHQRGNKDVVLHNVFDTLLLFLSQTPFTKKKDNIMLWVDKHRPSRLEDLTYHADITGRLEAMAMRPQSMPHLFFYGPSGSGKKTRIAALLRALFGKGTERLKLDKRSFKNPAGKVIDINMITSNYHIEISPGDAGLNDRFVVQEILKDIASSTNVTSSMVNNNNNRQQQQQGDNKESSSGKANFKVVVLSEVDRLSRPAQAALRRTMEKYSHTCRLILCCDSLSKVIEPLRSRCLGIRVGAPTNDEVRISQCKKFDKCR